MTSVSIFWSSGAKVSLLGHGRCTSNRPKSGYACPFGINLVLAATHVHGEPVGHLRPGPPPLSETAWPFAYENTFFRAIH